MNEYKPTPGCEEYCDGCKSRYQVSDYDGADGTYLVSHECDDWKDCSEFGNHVLESGRNLNEDGSADSRN